MLLVCSIWNFMPESAYFDLLLLLFIYLFFVVFFWGGGGKKTFGVF